jgi:hypothetical protein
MLDKALSYLTENDSLSIFYALSLRASLFTGFLTLSGFLFTVKTFLIVRMQQDVYGDEDYQDWVRVAQKYNASITTYGPLRRLGRWLFISVCASFLASLAQLTIGIFEQRWSTWLALGAAAFAAAIFFVTLLIIRSAIRGWIGYLEEKADKRQLKRKAELAGAPNPNA